MTDLSQVRFELSQIQAGGLCGRKLRGLGPAFVFELCGAVELDLSGNDDVAESHLFADAAAGAGCDKELGCTVVASSAMSLRTGKSGPS